MNDQEALDEFSFDIRWLYALNISEEDDYLSRRSLIEFRRRLAAKDPEMKLVRNVFDNIRDSAIKKLELATQDQRLDSTHIISNIRIRGKMALFSDTLDVFLKSLNGDQLSIVPADSSSKKYWIPAFAGMTESSDRGPLCFLPQAFTSEEIIPGNGIKLIPLRLTFQVSR